MEKLSDYDKHKDAQEEKSARDFHMSRIAFLIIDGEIKYLRNSKMSHSKWAKSIGIDEQRLNTLIRGYYADNNIVFYKGKFIYDDEVIEKAKMYAGTIKQDNDIKHPCKVYAGVKVRNVGVVWPPDMFLFEI